MATFTYVPDYSASVSVEPNINKVSFGDGYEARWSSSLNTALEEWSVTFKRGTVEANAIYTWLRNTNAVTSFNWTTPDGTARVVVCDSVSKAHDSIGWQTVTAKFRQVPEVALA